MQYASCLVTDTQTDHHKLLSASVSGCFGNLELVFKNAYVVSELHSSTTLCICGNICDTLWRECSWAQTTHAQIVDSRAQAPQCDPVRIFHTISSKILV